MGIDPSGDIFKLAAAGSVGCGTVDDFRATEFNIDRHLRYVDEDELRGVIAGLEAVCQSILSRYQVDYYLDEPVSGYPNWEFNHRFAAQGGLCLHFQASWVPGYLFFTADPAQLEPVPLHITTNGRQLVEAHVRARAAGAGKPLYVLNYNRVWGRLKDMALAGAKGLYRTLLRRSAAYIDRDPSAHFLHARALAASFVGRYDKVVADGDKLLVFPLHYEPEAVLLYMGKFRRQEEIAARLLDTLPLGWKLVLKEHPSQPGALHLGKWEDLRGSKRVVLLRGDFPLSTLLPRKPVVVSIGSTFALEAAMAGCRVGLLGGVHFVVAPGIHLLGEPEEWLRLRDMPEAEPQAVASWYGTFLDTYCLKGSIMRGRTDLGDQARLLQAIAAARQEMVS